LEVLSIYQDLKTTQFEIDSVDSVDDLDEAVVEVEVDEDLGDSAEEVAVAAEREIKEL
jgi:hypothetical protein